MAERKPPAEKRGFGGRKQATKRTDRKGK